MDPLIKSQLLYQLSYAPYARKQRHILSFLRSTTRLLFAIYMSRLGEKGACGRPVVVYHRATTTPTVESLGLVAAGLRGL